MTREVLVEPMYDAVLQASAPFFVGSPHKNTIYSLLSLRDDNVVLLIQCPVFWAWTRCNHLASDDVDEIIISRRVSVGKFTC